jgi:gamma-glutamylcyclotransferase (GGCT)/AIG2-like uncharacterized protein YtfP
MTDGHLYFAYGSNLDAGDWGTYCKAAGADPMGMRPRGPAWLPDHRLVFHFHSASRSGGAADVIPSDRGEAVPGVLMELTDEALGVMDAKEGHPNVYEREVVHVSTLDGRSHPAITYRVTPAVQATKHTPPSSYYEGLVRNGLESRALPTRHLDAAVAGLGASGHSIGHVFVYGTLLSGESRHGHLTAFNPVAEAAASATADLLDLGSYPGLIPGAGSVRGELYGFEGVDAVLESLDRIEGYCAGEPSLYQRVVLQVESGVGAQWAWTYAYAREGGTPIPSGDWREHRAKG